LCERERDRERHTAKKKTGGDETIQLANVAYKMHFSLVHFVWQGVERISGGARTTIVHPIRRNLSELHLTIQRTAIINNQISFRFFPFVNQIPILSQSTGMLSSHGPHTRSHKTATRLQHSFLPFQ